MADRLQGPRAKVERAKRHLGDVQTLMSDFLKAKPYEVAVKRDPETLKPIYYVSAVADTDPRLAAAIGDVLQTLRSALDHLAYQLVLVGTGKPGPFKHVYYPIFDSAAEYEAKRDGQIKGMRDGAIDAIDATKPYLGGNEDLWLISDLNKTDKHRLLITLGSAFRSVDIGGYGFRHMAKSVPWLEGVAIPSVFIRPADRLCPLKVGDELFTGGPDEEVDEKLKFAFDVALGEPEVAKGKPVLETLQQMMDLVDNLLPTFAPLLG
jgi:hypothetical protein